MPLSSSSNILGAQPSDSENTQILLNFISSLYKKDIIQKPSTFSSANGNIKKHLKEVEKYFKSVNISDNIGKVTILLETLDQREKNAIIFEPDYDSNSENYEWLKSKLLSLFPSKENQTSIISNLLNTKQNGKSIKEFILDIKNALAESSGIDKGDYSKIGLQIMYKGMDDKNLSKAIFLQSPTSLNEAEKLISSVVKSEEIKVNALRTDSSISKQIEDLQKQVAYLTQMILAIKSQSRHQSQRYEQVFKRKGFNTPQYNLNNKPFQNFKSNNFKNYNNSNFHLDRKNLKINSDKVNEWQEVPKKSRNFGQSNNRRCYVCGSFNHLQQSCPKFRRLNFLAEAVSSSSNKSSPPVSDISETEGSMVCCLNYNNNKKANANLKRKLTKVPVFKLCKDYPQDIINLEKAINEDKPKSFAEVVKSPTCAGLTVSGKSYRKFENKPFIKGRVNSIETRFFMDSGAEVNVIDESYLGSLDVRNRLIKSCKKHSIKCANNSQLTVKGEIFLPITVGVITKELPFIVVNQLSPKIIIGLRGLKSLKVEICPTIDAVKCAGIEIPFIAKTFSDSVCSKNVKLVH